MDVTNLVEAYEKELQVKENSDSQYYQEKYKEHYKA